jgi:hypothetical protein
MSTAPAAVAAPTTSTPATVEAAVDGIVSSLSGLSGAPLLAALPSVIISAYQTVVAFLDATSATQQTVLLSTLTTAIAKLNLPAADQVLVNQLLTTFIPTLITYLPKIEQGLIAGFHTVEEDTVSCCSAFLTRLGF